MRPGAVPDGVVHHLRQKSGGPAADAALRARFAPHRDEVAFAALVERHSRLVPGAASRDLAAGSLTAAVVFAVCGVGIGLVSLPGHPRLLSSSFASVYFR
jgi:hypothetical protein